MANRHSDAENFAEVKGEEKREEVVMAKAIAFVTSHKPLDIPYEYRRLFNGRSKLTYGEYTIIYPVTANRLMNKCVKFFKQYKSLGVQFKHAGAASIRQTDVR